MAYETKQAILEEAGLSQVVRAEVLGGDADGSNTVFQTTYYPLSDSNYDDVVDTSDITVYVNAAPVDVAELDAGTGVVTLADPPANGAVVTADYRYAAVADETVANLREEAQDLVNEAMRGIDDVPYDTVPATVRKIVRFYAAGMLLIRDYGFPADAEQTSKNGYAKLKLVEGDGKKPGWLARFVEIGGASGTNSVSAVSPDVQADDPVFDTYSADQCNGFINFDQAWMTNTDAET